MRVPPKSATAEFKDNPFGLEKKGAADQGAKLNDGGGKVGLGSTPVLDVGVNATGGVAAHQHTAFAAGSATPSADGGSSTSGGLGPLDLLKVASAPDADLSATAAGAPLEIQRRRIAAAGASRAAALLGGMGQVYDSSRLHFEPVFLDRVAAAFNDRASKRLEKLEALVNDNQDKTDLEKIELVHDFFQQNVFYMSDKQNSGQDAYWYTPVELLAVGAGDCEDYSLGKYVALRMLGLKPEQLRLVWAKSPYGLHMVVIARPGDSREPLVLDSADLDIKPTSRRRDLKPFYFANEQGGAPTGKGSWRVPPHARSLKDLSLLDDVLRRGRGLLPPRALD